MLLNGCVVKPVTAALMFADGDLCVGYFVVPVEIFKTSFTTRKVSFLMSFIVKVGARL